MALWWTLIFIIIGFNKRATCDYHCTKETSEVTCSGISTDQLSQDISATINKADTVTLNITNGIIPIISPSTFKDFNSLQSLYVTNSKVSNLEDDSISHSSDLTHLYLNNNTLTKFNARSVRPENGLIVLDLSYNRLNDLSDFNVSYFPKLNVLNLASNFLSYLPVNLLAKLSEQNSFYLVVDNNPWNCNDSNWSEYLTDDLVKAFCVNKTYIPRSEIDYDTTTIVSETTTHYYNGSNTETAAEVSDYTTRYYNRSNAETATEISEYTTRYYNRSNTETATEASEYTTRYYNRSDAETATEISEYTTRYYNRSNVETATEVSETTTRYYNRSNMNMPFLQIGDKNVYNKDNGTQLENAMEGTDGRRKEIPCEKTSCAKCSFIYCIYWFVGGIWIGIIVGNLPKIKRLICSKEVAYIDQYTQCDNIDQHMISGYRLEFDRRDKTTR